MLRKPETIQDLLSLMSEFGDMLAAHRELWREGQRSYYDVEPAGLEEQRHELMRWLAVLNPHLTRYSMGRGMGHPGTGTRWDAYQAAITGADVIKGPSLQHALLDLEGIIAVLETSDPDSAVDPPTAPRAARERRVFVSHGKDSPALTKVERFLRDLGVTPVIVKYGPSRGGAVDDVVEREMASCECAVILATKDDAVDGRWQPRPNVLHEIGLAQEKLKDRLIYLKEADCTYPSNIAPKIWETFTQDNLENAFSKIAKELRAFGVIS